DRGIPGTHGDDVCKAIVAGGSPTRVLMLTAAGSVEDRVEGLGIGADDYLLKPCDFAELVARIRALARRPGASLPPTLSHGDLRLDPSRRIVTRAGRPLSLNPKEFAVLEVLLAAPGVVVSAEEILERVWDEAADPFSQAVRTTMSRLRAQLRDPPLLETVPQAGHRIAAWPGARGGRLAALACGLRLRRRAVRFRMPVLYCLLFFPVGAVLVAVAYTIVMPRRAEATQPPVASRCSRGVCTSRQAGPP